MGRPVQCDVQCGMTAQQTSPVSCSVVLQRCLPFGPAGHHWLPQSLQCASQRCLPYRFMVVGFLV